MPEWLMPCTLYALQMVMATMRPRIWLKLTLLPWQSTSVMYNEYEE